MILTCPSCSASYNVPNDAIGTEGRTVRCKKCKHEWFQEGEKQALEDLINLIQSTDIDVDDIAFDDHKKKAKLPPPKKQAGKSGVSLRQKLSAIAAKIIPQKLKNYLFTGSNRSFLDHFASFMVALAVFTCLIYVLVATRVLITHAIPSLTATYEAAGFPLSKYARTNPEETFMIDRVAVQSENGKREVVGSLINITSLNIKVPVFKLAYLDEAGKTLLEANHTLPITALNKEGAYGFTIAVPDSVPDSLSSVKISFTVPH